VGVGGGGWGVGGGGWGPNPQAPIPNPQSPIPIKLYYNKKIKIIYVYIFESI